MTRLDLAYAVQLACLHMHDPRDCQLVIINRILRYVRGTATSGLLPVPSSTDIVAYSDANWAGCPDTLLDLWPLCVSRRHSGKLVLQTAGHRLPFERGNRVHGGCQCSYRLRLAQTSSRRARMFPSKGYRCLL